MASGSSSTSGSGSGSGSGQSQQSVPSSLDTLPPDECTTVDGNVSETEQLESVWGKLYPVGKEFYSLGSLDLKKESYVFGRDETCDVCYIKIKECSKCLFSALSKKHFEIVREVSDISTTVAHVPVVYIKDWSLNGTFLNGEKIGKGNKQVIQNNDEIQLTTVDTKAYVFIDLETIKQDTQCIPMQVKKKYTISKILGSLLKLQVCYRGVCGEVRLAFGKGKECGKYAMKIISKRTFATSNAIGASKNILEEAEILKKLDHPCIVKILDVIDTPESLYIILELVEGGELYNRVSNKGRLSEPAAKLIFCQILYAVQYLHDHNFTHRDLKPENVLLCKRDSENTLVKITDFGLSKFVGEQSLMKTLCGTPSYLAPEVLLSNGSRGYKKECDCWSLGVILFVCLGGYMPFSDQQGKPPLQEQVIEGAYSFPGHRWGTVSDEAKDLIRKLLTVDPQKRISVAKALEHPWMQDEEIIRIAKNLMTPTEQREDGEMAPPTSSVTKRKTETDSAPPSKRQKSCAEI